MRRAAITVLLGLGAAVTLAAPVCAQSQPAASSQVGLRRLDWAGKPEAVPAVAPRDEASQARPALRNSAPNRYSARVAPAETSRVWNPFPEDAAPPPGLRPTVSPPAAQPRWAQPQAVQPQPAPRPVQPRPAEMRPVEPRPVAPSPVAPPSGLTRSPPGPPMSVARPDTPPAAQPAPVQTAPVRPQPQAIAPAIAAPAVGDPEPPRSYADFSRPVTPAAASPASPSPAAAAPSTSAGGVPDMAPPRSYADFSRPMTPAAPAGAGAPAAPPRGEAPRYYSVHREYGRQPEQPQIPEAFFIDSVGGEDLAAPPEPLMSERDERRARAAAADPDAPVNTP